MSSADPPSSGDGQQQQQRQQKSYKEQLDEAAIKAKNPAGENANQGGLVTTVVEKGEQFTDPITRRKGLTLATECPNMSPLSAMP